MGRSRPRRARTSPATRASKAVRVGRRVDVEGALGTEGVLRDAPERSDGDGLLEELVEGVLPEVAGGPVDRHGDGLNGTECFERRDGVGENGGRRIAQEEVVARRKRRGERSSQGFDEGPLRPLPRKIDDETAVGAAEGEKPGGRLGRPAEERDLAGGEAVRLERGHVGRLPVVFGQQAGRGVPGLEKVKVGGREAAFAKDGLHVAPGESPRIHEGHGEAPHAVAPAAGGTWRGRSAVTRRVTGAERA